MTQHCYSPNWYLMMPSLPEEIPWNSYQFPSCQIDYILSYVCSAYFWYLFAKPSTVILLIISGSIVQDNVTIVKYSIVPSAFKLSSFIYAPGITVLRRCSCGVLFLCLISFFYHTFTVWVKLFALQDLNCLPDQSIFII